MIGPMRVLLCCLAAALLAAAPASALPRSAAKARLAECDTEARGAVFQGEMRAVGGATRLQMRFRLQTRTAPGERWTRVEAPGWGVWTTADPGIRRYVFTRRVAGLPAPGHYRAAIAYRWLDAAGHATARARRATGACRQPDPRPDLEVAGVRAQAGSAPGRLRYLVTLRNTGRSLADAFLVELTVGEEVLSTLLDPLAAGGRFEAALEGPACAADTPLTLRVDPDARVDERDETGNTVTTPCPVTAGA